MVKCGGCGYVCGESELVRMTEDYGERVSVCPMCHGVCDDAERCDSCGEYFFPHELRNGFCKDCIKSYITYDNVMDYLKDANALDDFVEWVKEVK